MRTFHFEKPVVYVDMDNVLVDFQSGIDRLPWDDQREYEGRYDEHPHIFALMEALPNAVAGFMMLCEHFDVYILSTAPWENPNAWMHKRQWVEKHLGSAAHKRLILSHNKHMNVGHYLIDDRTANGAGKFTGELIQFGNEQFPDWKAVIKYLIDGKRYE